MQCTVVTTKEADKDFAKLPVVIQARVRDILIRLRDYPNCSGVKHLRYGLKGQMRVRSGDWRVVFNVSGTKVTVTKIDNRSDVYKE